MSVKPHPQWYASEAEEGPNGKLESESQFARPVSQSLGSEPAIITPLFRVKTQRNSLTTSRATDIENLGGTRNRSSGEHRRFIECNQEVTSRGLLFSFLSQFVSYGDSLTTHGTQDSGGNAVAAINKLSTVTYYATSSTGSFTRRKCKAWARLCNGKSSGSLNRLCPRCKAHDWRPSSDAHWQLPWKALYSEYTACQCHGDGPSKDVCQSWTSSRQC